MPFELLTEERLLYLPVNEDIVSCKSYGNKGIANINTFSYYEE